MLGAIAAQASGIEHRDQVDAPGRDALGPALGLWPFERGGGIQGKHKYADDMKDIGYLGVEVLTGPGRRRKWSGDDRARIVAETLRPGTVVADVAPRWQVSSQQEFTWRREMRRAAVAPLRFVPIIAAAPALAAPGRSATPSVEVTLAGAALRIAPACPHCAQPLTPEDQPDIHA